MTLPDPPLLLVTDRRQALGSLADVLAAAFAGGCRWASLREKDLPADEQVLLLQSLLPLARAAGARLTLHGDAVLAQAAGADGVHLGAGGDVAAARALLGPHALVGLSVHAGDDLAALDAGALDYIVAGPAYPTESKPGYGPFLGPEGIAALVRATSVPVIAIGGIDGANARALCEAGAAGIAVMGGVMRASDPAAEVRQLIAAVGR